MKIEIMIYVYIAICISMIAFNIVYIFVLRHREKALDTNSQKLKKIICDQIEVIKNGKETDEFIIAIDSVGAGIGETVLITTGSSARLALHNTSSPADAVIVGIVD